MAKATVIKGGKVLVLLGNNASPIVYSSVCGLSSRTITFSKSLSEVNIPDCDDPDAVDWVGRGATSLSMTIAGEGVLAVEAEQKWWDALAQVESIPVKVEMVLPSKTITWTGKMQLETFEVGATNGETVTVSISMQSDGEMVRTSVDNP